MNLTGIDTVTITLISKFNYTKITLSISFMLLKNNISSCIVYIYFKGPCGLKSGVSYNVALDPIVPRRKCA